MAVIYNNIANIAKERNLTIKDIERGAGIANATIGKWRTQTPRVDSLKAVADFLKVSIDSLVKESK